MFANARAPWPEVETDTTKTVASREAVSKGNQSSAKDVELADEFIRQLRHEFMEVTQTRLETLDHELARLDEQAREAGDEVFDRWRLARADMNVRRRQVWDQLQRLPAQGWEDWYTIAHGIDDIRQDLSAAIAQARGEFKLTR